MKNILLISGGLDSMIIQENYKDEIDEYVYIKYRGDHPATKQELKIINEAGIKPKIIELDDMPMNEIGFYYGRNLKFIIAIRDLFPNENINIFIGNTANDNFSDNTRNYFYKLEDIINCSYPVMLRITCPLENRTKKSLIEEAKKKHINFYFCDSGNDTPCMKCHSCQAMIDGGFFNDRK